MFTSDREVNKCIIIIIIIIIIITCHLYAGYSQMYTWNKVTKVDTITAIL